MEVWSFVTTLTGSVVFNLCSKNKVPVKHRRWLYIRSIKNKTALVKLFIAQNYDSFINLQSRMVLTSFNFVTCSLGLP